MKILHTSKNHSTKNRIQWVDWMKTIGMFFIILGHFYPIGYKFIYVFNVPVFFIVSGFLTKQEDNLIIFGKKIFFNYILPTIIICTTMYFIKAYKYISPLNFIFQALIGDQACLDTCWFIYTLILLKIIYQFLPQKKYIHIILFITFTIISYKLNSYNIYKYNAFFNVFIAYQPFIIGYYLKHLKEWLNQPIKTIKELYITTISIATIFLCGYLNGEVWMYCNDYGNSFILFIIGAIAGTTLIYIICKHIPSCFYQFAVVISNGNIIILGFQMIFIHICKMIIPQQAILDYILAFLILLSFIPFIYISEKYFPYLIGVYRNKTKDIGKKH